MSLSLHVTVILGCVLIYGSSKSPRSDKTSLSEIDVDNEDSPQRYPQIAQVGRKLCCGRDHNGGALFVCVFLLARDCAKLV